MDYLLKDFFDIVFFFFAVFWTEGSSNTKKHCFFVAEGTRVSIIVVVPRTRRNLPDNIYFFGPFVSGSEIFGVRGKQRWRFAQTIL